MKTITLSFEWHCYPIWIYNENHIVILNDLPKEWEKDKDFIKLLDQAQALYDSAFLDTPKEFSFIGFQHPDDMDKMNLLLTKIRGFINKHLPKGYVFEDRIESYSELEGFAYEIKGKQN